VLLQSRDYQQIESFTGTSGGRSGQLSINNNALEPPIGIEPMTYALRESSAFDGDRRLVSSLGQGLCPTHRDWVRLATVGVGRAGARRGHRHPAGNPGPRVIDTLVARADSCAVADLEDFHRDFLPRFIDAQRRYHSGDAEPNRRSGPLETQCRCSLLGDWVA
jgi:hypothetical protein